MFKLNPVLLSLVAAQGVMFPVLPTTAAILRPYTPEVNDNKVGAYCLCNGSTQTLNGLPQFAPGESGVGSVTIGELRSIGRIINDNVIGAERLQIGPQNHTIGILDPNYHTYVNYQVFNSAELVDLPSVNLETVVPDYFDVNDKQYIDARVASVSNGTLNVDIGKHDAAINSSSNSWSMAAKQSQLFTASKKGNLNWNSNNRITFTAGTTPSGGDRLAYDVDNVVEYAGEFSVGTYDGGTTQFNVTNLYELRKYNDWLIGQLSNGNIITDNYNTEFNKAFKLRDGRVVYRMSTNNYDDEVALPIFDQVVLSADGPKATVKINRGKTLEVVNSDSAVMHASNGAKAIINGKLSSTGSGLELLKGARGFNNGVINSGFLNNADGKGVDLNTIGNGGIAVSAEYGSKFINRGVINLQPGAGYSAGITTYNSKVVNHGNINVGVSDVSNGGSASGVMPSSDGQGSFVNAKDGTIYIGRSPQNRKNDATQDVAVNMSGGVNGISQLLDSSAINNGHIVIGSKVQNATGMRVELAPHATTINNGVIDINGQAQPNPAENVGMLVLDSGSLSNKVINAGAINVNGFNSTGLKVIARDGKDSEAYSSGAINVLGDGDRYGTSYNTAVWVKGDPGGTAYANLTGPIRLGGTNGIGIRAEGSAAIDVSANSIPVSVPSSSLFTGRQISFYAVGPNARINLPANGSYLSSVYGGTIFRVEDGADFDGTGRTLSMTNSFATGVYGSGQYTDVNTNGGTFNISGMYARGIEITDGAQATIDANARIKLLGIGATAAIADGNKYTLQGEAINPATQFNPDTLLINHAPLSGEANDQEALIVKNQAQLINTGDITLGGRNTTGIRAESGAFAFNRGVITVTGNSTGLYANGDPQYGDGQTLTQIFNNGLLNVYSVDGMNLFTSKGVVAFNELARIYQSGTINLYGTNAMAGSVFAGGLLELGDGNSVEFHDPNQFGFRAADPGTRLITHGGVTQVGADNALLYEIVNGARLDAATPGSVSLYGNSITGIDVSGPGALVSSTDSYFTTGKNVTVLRASDTAKAFITSNIAMHGEFSTAAIASGGGTQVSVAAPITGSADNVTAFDVSSGAHLVNQQQGSVNFTGYNSTGARIYNGGHLTNRGSIFIASGIGVDVGSGYNQYVPIKGRLQVDDGIAAVRVGNAGWLNIVGDGQVASTIQARGGADGVRLEPGARGFEASDITILSYSSGSAINNIAESTNISLKNVVLDVYGGNGVRSVTSLDPNGKVRINVAGNGTGYLFENVDGVSTTNSLVLGKDYSIVVSGEGTGIRANTDGRVISRGVIDILDADGGSAIVTRNASQVINQGTISSQSRVSPLIDLRGGQTLFINQGTINAPFPDQVVVAGGAGSNVIALLDGSVIGDVNTGDGSDELIVTGGTLNGSLTMGNGEANQASVQKVSLANTAHITTENGAGSTLNLSELTARGGSFVSDDASKGTNLGAGWSTLNFYNTKWTLTDNIKLAHSTINIDAGSTLFAGDNVNPLLQGATNDSLVVNNAGTLDLTNGGNAAANVLTIDGELASAGGSLKLNSTATQSDTLRVNGNVSGTTLIEDTLVGGPLLDSNNDGVIAASEGVSLAQVTGSANATSFALKGGYVVSGPWQYGLASFAPGNSTAGTWDYRLANTFVCEDGSLCQPQAGSNQRAARLAVTPQVPSYISAPVGLAYYSLAVTDDLHKRLGELRQQQTAPDDVGGEMFIRYLGSNLKYQSNRGLADYGYDFDLDYSAVQLGGNVLRADGPQDSLRGGVAYTRGNTRIRPHAADGYSSTSFDSDSISLYGTWLRDSGFYLDGSLSWGWYRGETDIARQKEVASPKGNGWTASVESGYPFTFANGVRLEPQAQITWLQMKMDSFTDRDRTRVSYNDYDQTIGRIGARLDRTWLDASQNAYTPYLRANFYKGWGGTAKTKIGSADAEGSQTFESGKFGQMWDVGLGGSATLNKDVALYAEADYRKEIDGNGARGWRYNAGMRWSF
ncbi:MULTISPECIES: autotransporter outer membrane beta-barrel domain-containing protein [unclassified Enterobacter]|uniref:autotransporter outer membrane beta-barrel domain-containing protein n=1 Tax=unclassified Enterobacter TaxID=2608935 RepID=UPI0015CD96CC|nr:outer membrane autotransporter protein [Enterobacter sp. Sphag1F]NYI16074.1 outer membrane autotransporter protein [Enterobacter sp. Sphag71]